jgi:positive regulator of sigma E activity
MGCVACSKGPAGTMRLEADNPIGAASGDTVKLTIEAKGLIGSMIMIYLLPALGLIFGIVVFQPEYLGLAVGIGLMLCSFACARYYVRKRVSSKTTIVEVIK